jgi:hypothetical protein
MAAAEPTADFEIVLPSSISNQGTVKKRIPLKTKLKYLLEYLRVNGFPLADWEKHEVECDGHNVVQGPYDHRHSLVSLSANEGKADNDENVAVVDGSDTWADYVTPVAVGSQPGVIASNPKITITEASNGGGKLTTSILE